MALIFKNPQGNPEPAANYRHMAIIPPNKRLSGPPAMSWLYVAGLFRPDVKVEIEGIAAVD